jgi:hypothetical protein
VASASSRLQAPRFTIRLPSATKRMALRAAVEYLFCTIA